jgi:hypothetical protein
VWSSSTSPPGGAVGFFVLVGNDRAVPVSVTSVNASTDSLRLRMRDDVARRIEPAHEIEIPVSVRLTCVAGGGDPAPLSTELRVRREDGGSTTRRVDLQPASLVLDVAATLCVVRPGLRDHELSGPVLRAGGC